MSNEEILKKLDESKQNMNQEKGYSEALDDIQNLCKDRMKPEAYRELLPVIIELRQQCIDRVSDL